MPNMPEMDVMWTVTGSLLTDIYLKNEDIDAKTAEYQQKALDLIEKMK
jgi:arabinogalactan oligomer/maltooligosaccharide transport system substrate-binding protein